MPRADLEIHPDALLEAEAGVLWYLERSGGAAEHFFANLERALEIIVEAPERWPPYLLDTRRLPQDPRVAGAAGAQLGWARPLEVRSRPAAQTSAVRQAIRHGRFPDRPELQEGAARGGLKFL